MNFNSISDYPLQYRPGQSNQSHEARCCKLLIELYTNRYCLVPFFRKTFPPKKDFLCVHNKNKSISMIVSLQDVEELYKMQCNEWDPIIEWFNERYRCDLQKTCDIVQPTISAKTRMNLSKHLLSYNDAALHGFMYAADTLKSVILTSACVDKRISVEKAVELSRLEEEYQMKFWGKIEWAHDVSQQDTQARLAASVLFIHFNTSEHIIKEKSVI